MRQALVKRQIVAERVVEAGSGRVDSDTARVGAGHESIAEQLKALRVVGIAAELVDRVERIVYFLRAVDREHTRDVGRFRRQIGFGAVAERVERGRNGYIAAQRIGIARVEYRDARIGVGRFHRLFDIFAVERHYRERICFAAGAGGGRDSDYRKSGADVVGERVVRGEVGICGVDRDRL